MENKCNKKRLVLVPAFNEQEKIGQVITKIRESDKEIDILVVDDGSIDSTAFHARLAGAQVITLPFNMGYGVALQTGYKYAFERGYDYLVQLDADGQHDPAYIPELLKVIIAGDVDFVIGSRFLTKPPPGKAPLHRYRAGAIRKLGISLFAFLITQLVGLRVTDPTSGYQALNRRVIAFFIHDYFPCDYPDADVIVMIHRAGLTFKEIPVVMHERYNRKSMHSGMRPVYYVFKMFLSLFLTLLRKKPVPFYEKDI